MNRQTDGWTDGPTDQRTDRRMDRRTDEQTDRRTDGQTDGLTDTPSYRDAMAHLKNERTSEGPSTFIEILGCSEPQCAGA